MAYEQMQAEIRRSQMFYNIVSLIREGAISLEDLDGFSEELKQAAEASMNWCIAKKSM